MPDIDRPIRHMQNRKFISLFSGAGVGDIGFETAGFKCLAAVERDPMRAATFGMNIPDVEIFQDIRDKDNTFKQLRKFKDDDIDLLTATPPCQSFSTANPKRGRFDSPCIAKKDERNSLFFYCLAIIKELKPKIVVIENVPGFPSRKVKSPDGKLIGSVGDFIDASLRDYAGFQSVECMSDFGIPQRRKRSMALFCRMDLLEKTHEWRTGAHWVIPRNWKVPVLGNGYRTLTSLEALKRFRPLDGSCKESATDPDDPLHRVPFYDSIRYSWIAGIPPESGRSAYENDRCPTCGKSGVPRKTMHCVFCSSLMTNRPHVFEGDGTARFIKGFATSYRRMHPHQPASTVTTSSSHFGSDLKIHPTQNRVLSVRECAYLQTVPDDFDWSYALNSKNLYQIRKMIGEAIPTLFSYRLGRKIDKFLGG